MWIGITILIGAIFIADAIRELNGIKPWIAFSFKRKSKKKEREILEKWEQWKEHNDS